MKKVLITGSHGFIGSHLIQKLSQSYSLCFYDRKKKTSPQLESIYAVIHLAALAHHPEITDRQTYIDSNFELTKELALASMEKRIEKFIFISTIGVLGQKTKNDEVFTENSPYQPENPYSESKMLSEIFLKENWENDLVILRPSAVYGKNSKGNFSLISKLAGLPLPFKGINNKRQFIFIGHLIQAIENSLKLQGQNVFNISDPWQISTSELIELICKAKNQKNKSFSIPQGVLKLGLKATGQGKKTDQLFSNLEIDTTSFKKLVLNPVEKQEAFNQSF